MQCFDHALTLEIEHAQQVQRFEIIAPMFQNTGAQLFCPREITLLKTSKRLPLQARQIGHSA